ATCSARGFAEVQSKFQVYNSCHSRDVLRTTKIAKKKFHPTRYELHHVSRNEERVTPASYNTVRETPRVSEQCTSHTTCLVTRYEANHVSCNEVGVTTRVA
ncbi:hypothetical protein J6590_102992, partial [Homalodisca vitripennis]